MWSAVFQKQRNSLFFLFHIVLCIFVIISETCLDLAGVASRTSVFHFAPYFFFFLIHLKYKKGVWNPGIFRWSVVNTSTDFIRMVIFVGGTGYSVGILFVVTPTIPEVIKYCVALNRKERKLLCRSNIDRTLTLPFQLFDIWANQNQLLSTSIKWFICCL